MISIIIPTLNEEVYLPRLLKSIKRQDFLDYEIIVSDGGSSDSTGSIAREFDCSFVVDNEHRHPAWQRNNGAAVAQGELLLFLDADTILQEHFLIAAVNEFKIKNLGGAAFYVRFNPNRFIYSIYSLTINTVAYLRQFYSPIGIGAGILVSREKHNSIRGFDTSLFLAEDYDYCKRLSEIGKFKMIKSIKLLYSSRRLEKDGKYITLFKWLKIGFYSLLNIKIKKKIVNYDFGRFQK